MKRLINCLFVLVLAIAATGCDKAEPGGTATQALAGDWWVKYDVIDPSLKPGDAGYIVVPDLTRGYVLFTTYNTASNASNVMFVDDNANFWGPKGFKGKVQCNVGNKSFGGADKIDNYMFASQKFIVTNGRVISRGAHSVSGVVCDSIALYVQFSDDEVWVGPGDDDFAPDPYGTTYLVSGHRRTGFTEDEH